MSLSVTFVAIQHDDAAMLIGDPTEVDAFVDRERGFESVFIATGRWDALQSALSNEGFRSSHFIDETLSNGCEVVEPDLVFRQAQALACVDHEELRRTLMRLLPDPGEVDAQIRLFGGLSAFYSVASSRSLAVIFFAQ